MNILLNIIKKHLMGNVAFCNKSNCCPDIQVTSCYKQNDTIYASIAGYDVEKNEKNIKKMTELKNYFNEAEKEIVYNKKPRKSVQKKNSNKKKKLKYLRTVKDSNYEIMLQRLLEQKETKRKGPKRRETITYNNSIKNLVNEVIKEKKRNIKKNNSNMGDDCNNSILINNKSYKNNNIRKGMTLNLGASKKKVIKNNFTDNKIIEKMTPYTTNSQSINN